MTFREVVRELESRGVMPDRPPSLEPTRLGLERLSLRWPEDTRKILVVAGTNGKGSTSKTLEQLLLSADQSVGLYTSPHLVDIRERIRADDREISEEEFVAAYKAVLTKTADLALSHFEMLTLMAAWFFFSGELRRPITYAIFEVGLGGTWDATNATPHKTSVICKLGLDHLEFLGPTLTDVARNKFGVVTAGCDVVHLPLDPSLQAIAGDVRAQTKSYWKVSASVESSVDSGNPLPIWRLQTPWGQAEISLPGERGAENTGLALTVFEHLGFAPHRHLSILSTIRWPGRMQRIEDPAFPCPVFLSGDHNPQGIESLIELLTKYRYETLHLVVAVGIRKDLDSMLTKLREIPRVRILLTTASFQGRTREQYGDWVDEVAGFESDPRRAVEEALRNAKADDLCVVTGSLYLIGDILREIESERRR